MGGLGHEDLPRSLPIPIAIFFVAIIPGLVLPIPCGHVPLLAQLLFQFGLGLTQVGVMAGPDLEGQLNLLELPGFQEVQALTCAAGLVEGPDRLDAMSAQGLEQPGGENRPHFLQVQLLARQSIAEDIFILAHDVTCPCPREVNPLNRATRASRALLFWY